MYSFAAIPTVEGLFRNPINPDLEKKIVVLQFGITSDLEESLKKKTAQKAYYKVLIDLKDFSIKKVLFLEYKSEQFFQKNLKSMNIVKDIKKKITEEDNFVSKLIYSILIMYGANSSEGFDKIFKGISLDYRSNLDTMNGKKENLLGQYKNYLVRKKEIIRNQNLIFNKEELVSPLALKEKEKQEEVEKIMNKSMYKKSSFLELVKKGKSFFWKIEMTNISAIFTNEEHILKEMLLYFGGVNYNISLGPYVIYSGIYFLPKKILIEYQNYKISLDIINYYTLNNKRRTFRKHSLRYHDLISRRSEKINEEYLKEKKLVKNDEEGHDLISQPIEIKKLINF